MTYEMDAETYETLYRWMARNAPLGASIIDECDAVVTYLQNLDADDAAYFMERGWGRCYEMAQTLATI